MAKIIFKGIASPEDPDLLAVNSRPANAHNLPLPTARLQILFMLPAFLVCMGCMAAKARLTGRFPLFAPLIPAGILLGVLGCLVHELLHALPQPKGARAYIGFIPKGFLFFMKCKEPVSRRRFIFMALLPVAWGALPLALFWFSESPPLNALLWPMAMIGLASPSPDYANVWRILREVPPNGLIQDDVDGLCWFVP